MAVAIRSTWEHFAHGADIGVRGIGPSKEAAFEQIALALTGVISDLKSVRLDVAVRITCEAPTDDVLLVDWLNALVCTKWPRDACCLAPSSLRSRTRA